MTRKDYQLIAGAFNSAKPENDEGPQWRQWAHTTHKVITTLAADNPRFDRAKFLEACGV